MSHVTLVNRDTPVEDLVDDYPAAIRFLVERGILCVVCGEVYWGTVGALMDQKGITDQALIIETLNAFLAETAVS
ncbi:MAG: hypothetical protein GYB65_15075 [Chloroflexi bacterium]|nr:hypothetical protein [Chloroflexota bacterium]